MAENGAIDISPQKDGGVLKEILKEGVGDDVPAGGSQVQVHYTGTLLDGTKFDSSRDRGEPFEFKLGKGSVIKAWDIGVATMKKGEVAILTCAPEYAYGKAGSPPSIPPDSTLKFEVEVLGWRGEDISPKKDGGIERYQITPGEKYATPNDGALVEAHIRGSYEGNQFEDRDVTFTLGEGSEVNVIPGVEKGLEKFKKGETSRLIIKPQYAFGAAGKPEFNVPPNATVEYIVTLKSFEKAKDSWSLDLNEKVEQARLFKEKGTKFFKDNKIDLAVRNYKKIISFLDSEQRTAEKEGENVAKDVKSLLLSAHLNLALCYLKQEEHVEARTSATAALALDNENEKAYYRRGQAYLALGEPQSASKDFTEVLRLEPNNKAAQSQLVACQKTLQQQLQKEKKIYANMFDKFAKLDTQKEEVERLKQPDVMSTLGEWAEGERERAPSDFEKENPNILLLNGSGEFKDM